MCELESGSFCLWKEKLGRIIAVTPGKESSAVWNNQPSHNAHTGEKRGTKKGERTGREVAITGISWLPVGLDADIVYERIWKCCYIIILLLMLWWAQTKGAGVWHIAQWQWMAALTCCYKAAMLKWAWITIYCSAVSGVQIPAARTLMLSTRTLQRWPVCCSIIIRLLYRNTKIEILNQCSSIIKPTRLALKNTYLIYCTDLGLWMCLRVTHVVH